MFMLMAIQASENRIYWIDNLKAIGIYLMVLGHHTAINPSLLKYIYSFHMPLFFFISGFLFDRDKYPTIKSFILSRTQTLLVPYLLFSFLTYIFWCALIIIRHPEQIISENNDLFTTLSSIFLSSNGIIWMSHNAPLWFLTCLFLLEIQFFIMIEILKYENSIRIFYVIIFTFLVSLLGYIVYLHYNLHFPWGLEISWTVMVFYLFGYILRQALKVGRLPRINFPAFIILPALLVLSIVSSQMNSFINLAVNQTGNYVLFLVSAFSGIGLSIALSLSIKNYLWIEYLGKNTIFILGFFSISVSLCIGILSLFSMRDSFYNGNTYISIILSAIQIILILPLIPIAKKVLFWLNVKLFNPKTN